MTDDHAGRSPSLSELPIDELVQYGRSLGLEPRADAAQGELLRLVRARQELLVELDRDAMLDVVVWLRRPVKRSAGKEELAQVIAQHNRYRFPGLSDRGLHVLARLSGIEPQSHETREDLERRLRRVGGVRGQIRRLRRGLVGSLVDKLLSGPPQGGADAYRFLPEDHAQPSFRDAIEETGLVGGVARKLRGVADDYVKEKLDEIERRIDRKLDEIDLRLGEWRDREMSHRLRILKITLLFSILVVILSLIYDYLRP